MALWTAHAQLSWFYPHGNTKVRGLGVEARSGLLGRWSVPSNIIIAHV